MAKRTRIATSWRLLAKTMFPDRNIKEAIAVARAVLEHSRGKQLRDRVSRSVSHLNVE